MKKIIDLESKEEHYHADAWCISCIDDRFKDSVDALEATMKWDKVDRVKWAGGAQGLTQEDPENPSPTGFLDQIRKSIKLHDTKEIVLSVHEACGAYGSAMPKDHAEARAFMAQELKKAKEIVATFLEREQTIRPVRAVAFAFDGVYEIE